jgi:Ser-tRNA(Ala) deacylase AlaX
VTEVERRVNAEIEANREVRIRFLPRAEAFTLPDLIRTKINLLPEEIEVVRVCEISGMDLQADGGRTSHELERSARFGSRVMRARDASTSGCA